MANNTENFIFKQIQRIIQEERKSSGDSSSNVQRGYVGKGGIKANIRRAKALAHQNPHKLMEELRIPNKIEGNTTPKIVLNLIRAAIYGTDLMRRAYSGAVLDEMPKKSIIRVSTSEITPRDGTLYMTHTLYGAEKAKLLKATDHKIVVNRSSNGVEIVLTKIS